MYQENELKKLYERLKAQYPQYQLEFSGDSLTLNRLYCKVEVNQSGVKIYVNGNLYDQFTSEYVDDLDDLYELIEVFLLDLQHVEYSQFSASQAPRASLSKSPRTWRNSRKISPSRRPQRPRYSNKVSSE